MNPKGKKAPKNAFWFFLDDYVNNLRQQGCHISYRIAAEECGAIWKDLPEEEKKKYQALAASHKEYSKQEKHKKFTCSGISFAQLEQEQKELRKKTEKEDNEIKLTMHNLDCESLKDHLFYLIHCNYFCKTAEGVYIPAELAVSEFSLRDGIRRTFHTLINPGAIPLGYAFEARQTIEEVHGLPYPPSPLGVSNYCELYDKVVNFLEPGKNPDGMYPPLYCIENNIKATESILQLFTDSSNENQNVFRVYLLHKMFFALKNKCVEYLHDETYGFPVASVAENEISKDVFCYTPGISCVFHAGPDSKYHNCSLSVVQRFVFTICDHCCQYLDIPLIPGKHCRQNADVSRKNTTHRKKEGASSNRTRKTFRSDESEIDKQSSYFDETSSFRSQRGCFLHDEIESCFSSHDVSSIASTFKADSDVRSVLSTRSTMKKLNEVGENLKNLTVDSDDSSN